MLSLIEKNNKTSWEMVHLKLHYARANIEYSDNLKIDFRDTIETGFRIATELQSEVVEMEKASMITRAQRDRILSHTCAFDVEYFASGQSMGLCSVFAEIAPYSAYARACTILIDGYWKGDFDTVNEHLPVLLEMCETHVSECQGEAINRILYSIKEMQDIYENTKTLQVREIGVGKAIVERFSMWKRVDIYTGATLYTIKSLLKEVNDSDEEVFKLSSLLPIQTEKGSFSTQIKSPHSTNHTVQLNILRSSYCSTWHRMRSNCRTMGVLSVKGKILPLTYHTQRHSSITHNDGNKRQNKPKNLFIGTGRDVVVQSDFNTFHWMSSNVHEYLDFAEALVRSMEETLVKRRHVHNGEKMIFWDIACGTGWMSQYVAASLPNSFSRIVASDIDNTAVAITKHVSKTNGFEDLIHVKQGNLLEPFQDESPADFIFMYPPQMNHEIAKTAKKKGQRFTSAPVSLFLDENKDMKHFFEKAIDQIHNILKPGGKMVLGIDHRNVEHVVSYVHRHASLHVSKGLHNGLHVRLLYGKFLWDPSFMEGPSTPSVLIEIQREGACGRDDMLLNGNIMC